MRLNKINPGMIIRCNCTACGGAGVYKGSNERGGIAVVCFYCNGKGYYNRLINFIDKVYYDLDKDTVVEEKDGEYVEVLFKGLKKKDGIKYVVYESTLIADEEFMINYGLDSLEVLPYEVFLKGKVLPLPIQEFNCPARLEQHYNEEQRFDNNCYYDDFVDCPKYGCKECWKKFYGKIRTYSVKQDKLKGMCKESKK